VKIRKLEALQALLNQGVK